MGTPSVGMCFDRTFPAGDVMGFARELEEAGADQLWVIEDCFFTAGISLAASALAVTERLQVGLGILPAVARNPAVTAMELATLCNIAPGRVMPGIGHGVQAWMEQIGERTPSPLTTLDEVITVVRRLLHGETVTFSGREVTLADVTLEPPPTVPPPVLAGVQGPKSMEVAGRVADGLVLAEASGPTYIEWALDRAGRPDDFSVAVFTVICIEDDPAVAYANMAPWLSGVIGESRPSLHVLPFADEMFARFERHGEAGLATMPADWWRELGAIGGFDDAVAHVSALAAAGASNVGLFPSPDVEGARSTIAAVAAIKSALD